MSASLTGAVASKIVTEVNKKSIKNTIHFVFNKL